MVSFSRKDEAFFISRLILITGGARAGKSRFAQALAEKADVRRRLFVATGVACDQEMQTRIARHRKERDGRWATLEEPTDLPDRLPASHCASGNLILVDCLPTFVTNLLMDRRPHSKILSRVRRLIAALRRPGLLGIVVTNEVGLGLVPDHPLGREFRDLLGMANQKAAEAADEVYFVMSGLPMRLK